MTSLKLLCIVLLLGTLSACAKSVWAPDEAVTKFSYVSDEPPSITLITVVNNRDGSGGHSSLLINAHERVVFDPAGNFKSKYAPERNDFLYGMQPLVLDRYIGFHARKAWHVILQEKIVSPEVAEQLFQMAKNNGAVPSSFCANAVTHLLKLTPGFESIQVSFSPIKTMHAFAEIPGVTTTKIVQMD